MKGHIAVATTNLKKDDIGNAFNNELVRILEELDEKEIKSYLRKSLYEHQQVKDMTNNAQHIIKILFNYFTDDPKRIPKDFKKDTTDAFERTVSDYIAGMTDRFAIHLHNNLI